MEKYRNAALPVDERVEDLLSRMTLREKVGQLNQHLYGWMAYRRSEGTETEFELTDLFKEHVEWGAGMGALYGLFRADPWSGVTYENGIPTQDNAKLANAIQRYVIEHSRLGIPVLLSEECPHGHQALDGTLLPVNTAIGSTWNPELIERAYSHVASEIRSRGAHLGLVSVLDILQDPRWGRSEECYGEDPYLAARMTEAVVFGMQGRNPEEWKRPDKAAAVLKHLCAQGAGQGGRNAGPVPAGERELREIHLPAAEAGIKAGAAGVMAAYNELDGIPCHANDKLLTGILRDEWGFDGIVMADGTAIDRLVSITGDYESAAALALSSGVDLSLWDKSFTTLEQAVKQGKADMEGIDRAVGRVLGLKFRLGLFEQPYVDEGLAASTVNNAAARELNVSVAREAVVLLKNDNSVLPLNHSRIKRLAVIGPNADRLYNQLGDYTSVQREGSGVTALQGIRMVAPEGTDIVFAPGCSVRGMSTQGLPEAIEAARSADAVVLVLGGSSARQFGGTFDNNGAAIVAEGDPTEMDCGEGVDLAELRLGGIQEQLVREIHAIGKPVITVLIQGRPLAVGEVAELSDALLCAWYPGSEGGRAIGEILFGQVNPSGKLPVSIPRSVGQLPVYYNQKNAGRPRPYVDMPSKPLYPFGFGLSYSSFEYGSPAISQKEVTLDELRSGSRVEVCVEVENSGKLKGDEVVQLYIQADQSGITRRLRELKGFRKVMLEPGDSTTVSFELGFEELAIWNRNMDYDVVPCRVSIVVGGHSDWESGVVELKVKA
ncbi:glycoside hydrolase family 3 N-terminal domain-containing protein [Paenibacillus lautus]|uniref:glycoside hydrolase family 3 N-terminal domain-containing protein n=1 Tax=Paenibacillus lautus TaxID=1401 RepID=UPI002FBE08A5